MWRDSSSSSSDEDEAAERLPHTYRERINTVFRTEYEFNERFRMKSDKMESLCVSLGPHLQRPTNRSRALSVKLQLCIALHWLGSGGQYHTVSDMHGVSKDTVCKVVHNTVEVVNLNLFQDIVKWPTEIISVVQQFQRVAGMPMVIGCIDGILINIDAPSENEQHYVDRHGNHSINCMAVCGPDCRFYYISARWPGSVHDSRVLRNSSLFQELEISGWSPLPNGVLLGDSGYPLLGWLLTPTGSNTNALAVQRYNQAHKSTRRLVENSFGILREKFPCLNHLRVHRPEFACEIFKCCATLCNIIRTQEDMEAVLENNINIEDEDNEPAEQAEPGSNGGIRLAQMISYFN